LTVEQWLGENNTLGIDICTGKYMQTLNGKKETFDEMINRISNGNESIKNMILKKKFIYGGRTMTNYNTGRNASTSNCYSSGYAPDSVSEIMDLAKNLAITYKTQGGQGLSLSKIRPKGSSTSGGYESDGIIPFMRIFDRVTESISQGGSRKGALMMSLDAWHKEAETFITVKSKTGEIEKANLSLEIDNEFMDMVKHFYLTGEKLIKHITFKYDSGEIKYDVCPIDVYKSMCLNAFDWAEPGIIFTNEFRNHNIMEFVDDYKVVTGNPCGEQPLPKNGACNLGSMNLSEYVINPYTENAEFDLNSFKNDVGIAITALDEVLDYGFKYHALQEQRDMAINYRNTGLGVMGVASMFLKMGITYGDEQSLKLIDSILYEMFRSAVISSSDNAVSKGSFPKYTELVWKSKIIKEHFTDDEIEELKLYGLRNCSLLSIAPSGSIGTMLNVSTGCEPIFRMSYKRKTETLHKNQDVYYDVFIDEATEYMKKYDTKTLPEYFVSSDMIPWKNRIDMQSTMQKHIDTAISSTLNLPKESTLDDIEKVYLYGWEQKLKGMTIYVDGCKRTGILTSIDDNKDKKVLTELKRGDILLINNDEIGKKRRLITGCGSLHCTAWFDPVTGDLLETFFDKGSSGGCNNFMIGLSRTISLCARLGGNIYTIVDQLNSSGLCSSYTNRTVLKHDTSKGACCPMAIGNALIDMYKEVRSELGLDDEDDDEEDDETEEEIKPKKITIPQVIKQPTKIIDSCIVADPKEQLIKTGICPQCAEPLIFEGGCNLCKSCGWSRCS